MPRTIDMTPTWRAILPALLDIYRDGMTQESRDIARAELYRMAEIADAYVVLSKTAKESDQ